MPFTPRRRALAPLAAVGAWPSQGWAQAPEAVVLVPDDVLRDRERGAPMRRDLAELALLLEALDGWPGLRLLGVPTAARLFLELRGGRGVVSGTSFFARDGRAEGLLLSEALLRPGEMAVGVYTLPDHPAHQGPAGAFDPRRWRALCNRDWQEDWAAWQALGVQALAHVATWPQMVRMLAAGRADLVLAPFSARQDLAIHVEGIALLPVPGVKVGLSGSRHFVLSAGHPQRAALAQRLDATLRRWRDEGRLRRAYTTAGLFNPAVQGWRCLGDCPAPPSRLKAP